MTSNAGQTTACWALIRCLHQMSPNGWPRQRPSFIRIWQRPSTPAGQRRATTSSAALVAAQDADGTQLSDDEAIGAISLLLQAGNITTTDLIGNGVLACCSTLNNSMRCWPICR